MAPAFWQTDRLERTKGMSRPGRHCAENLLEPVAKLQRAAFAQVSVAA